MSAPSVKATALSTYRTLHRLIRSMPSLEQQHEHLNTLQSTYRENQSLTDSQEIKDKIREAGERISFLRISTPKKISQDGDTGRQRWIYTKDGKQKIEGDRGGTKRDDKGRVVSNWDGKNLDPCSVKTHYGQLKRAGFVNNSHAKGIF